MSETWLALVPEYGAFILLVVTFLSCLALPVPASLVMLAGGAFAAGGDLSPALGMGFALTGAIAGDQVGFAIGRWGRGWVDRFTLGHPKREALILRAQRLSQRRGGPAIFLSRWLFSPLGPYMNFITGAAQLNWATFTLWGVMGEVVWVSLYISLGYGFSAQIEALASLLGDISGTLAAGVVTLVLGQFLWKHGHRPRLHLPRRARKQV